MIKRIIKASALIVSLIYIGTSLFLQTTGKIDMFESIAGIAMGTSIISLVIVFDLWEKFDSLNKKKSKHKSK